MGVMAVFTMLVVVFIFHVFVVEHAPFGANSFAGDLLFIDVQMVGVVVMIFFGRAFRRRGAIAITTATTSAATTAATLATRFTVGADFHFARLSARLGRSFADRL